MNTFIKVLSFKNEIESWKGFADSLHPEEDKEHFREMLIEYHKYFMAISSEPESFRSEQLVVALLSWQYKKIIDWSIEKWFQNMRNEVVPCSNIL
jgi:hypothetical protein